MKFNTNCTDRVNRMQYIELLFLHSSPFGVTEEFKIGRKPGAGEIHKNSRIQRGENIQIIGRKKLRGVGAFRPWD